MTHKHHIIPRHAGGTDDSTNIVELSVTCHAMWHYAEWTRTGKWQDKSAWRGLSGTIDSEEFLREMQIDRGRAVCLALHQEKDEDGKSLHARQMHTVHRERDPNGYSKKQREASMRAQDKSRLPDGRSGLAVAWGEARRIPVTLVHLDTGEQRSYESCAQACDDLGLSNGLLSMILSGHRNHTKRWTLWR